MLINDFPANYDFAEQVVTNLTKIKGISEVKAKYVEALKAAFVTAFWAKPPAVFLKKTDDNKPTKS